jgi:hypothetical protein
MHEFGAELGWRVARRSELRLRYSVQRLQNPLQMTSVDPVFGESAIAGVTAINRLLWSGLTTEF